jgi:copper chaperone CopZ
MKTGILLIMIGIFSSCATMKDGSPVKKVVQIQTSAQCDDCKERIETKLNYEKGVVYSELDLDTKKVEVKFNQKQTSEEQIRKAIAAIGYHADDVKADVTAQSALPECCQPGGHKD